MEFSSNYFIVEVTSSPRDLKIISESFDKDNNTGKIKFKTILQTADELNANRRTYSKQICEDIISQLSPIAKNRSLLQEVDHPVFNSNDEKLQLRRAGLVELNNCGSMIQDIRFDGKNIIGECETLSGFKGPDLYNVISKDKVNIGFSVRMFGKLTKHPSIQEAVQVQAPIKVITYDVVINPSHKSAKVMNFVPEGSSISESRYISENEQLILNLDKVNIITRNPTEEYFKMLLTESFNRVNKNLTFKV